jgi:DNA-binding transcriptional ArsR family regulator
MERDQYMDTLTYDDKSYSGASDSSELRESGEAGDETNPGGRRLLGWEALDQATQCLKSVAHPIRLRILELLMSGEYSVGELADLCEVDQPTASGHLAQLRNRGILRQERQGRQVYYRVAAPAIGGIVTCMRTNFGPSSTGNGCRG